MNEKTPLTDDLLPCPFCGGRAEWKQGHFTGYVMCLKCETFGPNIAKNEAVAAWNTRAGIGTGAAPAETAPQPDRDPSASKSHDVAREAGGGVVEALNAEWLARIREKAAEVRNNSLALEKFDFVANEARFRALAALYLEEVAQHFERMKTLDETRAALRSLGGEQK